MHSPLVEAISKWTIIICLTLLAVIALPLIAIYDPMAALVAIIIPAALVMTFTAYAGEQ